MGQGKLSGLSLLLLLAGCAPMPTQTREAISDWKSGKPDVECEIPGDSSQWQADYCLAASQTDDLVAAQPCIDFERRRSHGEECAARRHYKQDWCRVVTRNGMLAQSMAECIADPDASGPVVKNDGS